LKIAFLCKFDVYNTFAWRQVCTKSVPTKHKGVDDDGLSFIFNAKRRMNKPFITYFQHFSGYSFDLFNENVKRIAFHGKGKAVAYGMPNASLTIPEYVDKVFHDSTTFFMDRLLTAF